jgi:hypothetical protein
LVELGGDWWLARRKRQATIAALEGWVLQWWPI